MSEKSTRSTTWRKPLVSLGLALGALGCGELGYRIYGAARGVAYDAAETRVDINAFGESMANRFSALAEGEERQELRAIADQGMSMIPHPFFAFEFVHKQEQILRDLEYFERTKGEGGTGKPGFDILILGGSVAAEFRAGGVAHMIGLLAADPRLADKRLREFVYARGSGKQPQQLNLLTYLLSLGFAPDVVINLDGFNEVALATTNQINGVHPLHPAHTYWLHLNGSQVLDTEAVGFLLDMKLARRRVEELVEQSERWGLHRSALLGRWTLSRLTAAQGAQRVANESYTGHLAQAERNRAITGPAFAGDSEAAIAMGVRSWSTCSASMQAICDVHGIIYLHALQPTLHDRGSKVPTPWELRVGRAGQGWRTAAASGYPQLRAAGAELVKRGVGFVDTSGVFRDEANDIYKDACHFNEAGNRLLAEQLAKALLAGLP
ncbi:MAG: hypothetical protein QF615_08205 [Planctomycetota bacterium]|jgi:hypothetical protein|nr:hypothetical protein [Planctomycetota bacterium]